MLSDLDLEECFKVAIDVTKHVTEIVKEACSKEKRYSCKTTPADLVTETDQEVEKIIIQTFKEKFPGHRFIGEESVAAGIKNNLTDEPTWIIDPIDGTCNFVHTYPFAAISIALFVNKEPVIGIVQNVLLGLTYHARKGKGSFCNEKKLEVSPQTDLSEALVATEMGIHQNDEMRTFIRGNLERLGGKLHGIRSSGSAAINICHVASGCLEAYFEFGLHIWDIAAGMLILEEAGGVNTDTEGGPLDPLNRRIIAANNKQIATQISQTIAHVELERD